MISALPALASQPTSTAPTAAATASSTLTITEYQTSGGSPVAITSGPDGNVWWGDQTANITGRITPAGTVTEFSGIGADGIVTGPDGNLWLATGEHSAIAVVSPSIGSILNTYSTGGTPLGITATKSGNLWFTDVTGNRIGEITTGGQLTMFSQGITPNSNPEEITEGPDGNLWFTQFGEIGRITPTGVVTEFTNGITGTGLFGVTTGPDGNLWFTEERGVVGRITTSGVVTEFSNGFNPGAQTLGITSGPDGNVWFTDNGTTSAVGIITTSGAVTEFSDGVTPNSEPVGITVGPDSNLWFTEARAGKIGRVNLVAPSVIDHFAVTPSVTTTASGAALTVTVMAEDSSGNRLSGYGGTVTFSSTDPAAVLPRPYQFTLSDAGVHTFAVTLYTLGAQTLGVSDLLVQSAKGVSPPISITVTSPTPTTITAAGVAISAYSDEPFAQGIATFSDNSSGTSTAQDYNVSINWGDGSPLSAGDVTEAEAPANCPPNCRNIGEYLVEGQHTYTISGHFKVTVIIAWATGNPSVQLMVVATVATPPTANYSLYGGSTLAPPAFYTFPVPRLGPNYGMITMAFFISAKTFPVPSPIPWLPNVLVTGIGDGRGFASDGLPEPSHARVIFTFDFTTGQGLMRVNTSCALFNAGPGEGQFTSCGGPNPIVPWQSPIPFGNAETLGQNNVLARQAANGFLLQLAASNGFISPIGAWLAGEIDAQISFRAEPKGNWKLLVYLKGFPSAEAYQIVNGTLSHTLFQNRETNWSAGDPLDMNPDISPLSTPPPSSGLVYCTSPAYC